MKPTPGPGSYNVPTTFNSSTVIRGSKEDESSSVGDGSHVSMSDAFANTLKYSDSAANTSPSRPRDSDEVKSLKQRLRSLELEVSKLR